MSRILRHVVLFAYKADAPREAISRVAEEFSALPSRIDCISGFEWGSNISPENLGDGFEHCFIVSFRTEADRDRYLPHPEHRRFSEFAGPYLERVIVHDFWGNES